MSTSAGDAVVGCRKPVYVIHKAPASSGRAAGSEVYRDMLPFIMLITACLLVLALVIMALMRINKEGLTLSAPAEQKHFVRSVEDVKRRHEQELVATSLTEDHSVAGEMVYTRHGFGRAVELEFDKAVERVQASLQQEKLRIKEDMDINQLLKRGEEPPYHVISFYHRKLAAAAVAADPSIGLLLFSAVVRRDYSDIVHVEFSDPVQIIEEARLAGLEAKAVEIKTALTRILIALS